MLVESRLAFGPSAFCGSAGHGLGLWQRAGALVETHSLANRRSFKWTTDVDNDS